MAKSDRRTPSILGYLGLKWKGSTSGQNDHKFKKIQEKTANKVGKDKMEKKTREFRVNQTYFNLRLTVGILAGPFKGHRQSTQKKLRICVAKIHQSKHA